MKENTPTGMDAPARDAGPEPVENQPNVKVPLIAVAGDKYNAGQAAWLWTRTPGSLPPHQVVPLTTGITTEHATDAHFVGYVAYRDGVAVRHQPRVNKDQLAQVREHKFELLHTVLVADVDTPGHAPLTPAQLEDARLKLASLPTIGWYTSRAGLRILQPLLVPITPEHYEAVVPRWLDGLQAVLGRGWDVDRMCKDWTRLFRLPFVIRDGQPTKPEIHLDSMAATEPPPMPPVAPVQRTPPTIVVTATNTGSVVARARRYVSNIGVPTCGQSQCEAALWAVALHVARGFSINEVTAIDIVTAWASRSKHKWKPTDIQRKVRDAANSPTLPNGFHLTSSGSSVPLDGGDGIGVEEVGGPDASSGSSSTEGGADPTSDVPVIRLGPDTHRVVREAVMALGGDVGLYVLGNVLARIIEEGNARVPVADAVTVAVLRAVHLSEVAHWETWDARKKEWKRTDVPEKIARPIHELHAWPNLRRLVGIAETPVMRADGSVLDTPGYDASTGLLYLPRCDFAPVPERPTAEEVDAAKEILFEVVADFPLIPSAKATWLAMLLTFFGRPMFDGPAPGIAVDANNRGAGKGLLCDVTGRICTGRALSVTTPTEDEDELRKRTTATLMRGVGMVLVDNLPKSGEFGNATWDALLTAEEWGDRVLGVSENVIVPNHAVWVVTGNNIRVKGDTTRRLLHIRLETDLEHPERRDPSKFRHADLRGWVAEHRTQLVRAALTILRAWVVAGRPRGTVNLGSYESWAETIGACVQWLGLGDVTFTQKEYETRQGDTGDSLSLRPLLLTWNAAFGSVPMTCSEVLRLVRDEDQRLARERRKADRHPDVEDAGLDDAAVPMHKYKSLRDAVVEFSPSKRAGLPDAAWFGRRIGAAVKQVVGGLRFEGEPDRDGVMQWRVAAVAGACGGIFGDAPADAPAPSTRENTGVHENCGGIGGISSPLNVGKCQVLDPSPTNSRSGVRDHVVAGSAQNAPVPPQTSESALFSRTEAAGAFQENAPADAPAMPPQQRLPPSPTTLPAGRYLAHPSAIGRSSGGLVVQYTVPATTGGPGHYLEVPFADDQLDNMTMLLGWSGERDAAQALVRFDALVELDLYYATDDAGRARPRLSRLAVVQRH